MVSVSEHGTGEGNGGQSFCYSVCSGVRKFVDVLPSEGWSAFGIYRRCVRASIAEHTRRPLLTGVAEREREREICLPGPHNPPPPLLSNRPFLEATQELPGARSENFFPCVFLRVPESCQLLSKWAAACFRGGPPSR